MHAVRLLPPVALLVAILACPTPAAADPIGWGVRAGVTDDPDSAFFGLHAFYQPRGTRELLIEPSGEFGVGDNFFSIRGNLRFKYLFAIGRRQFIYPLLGPSLYFIDFDGGSDSGFGIDLGMGFAFSRIFLDFAVGISDIPDLTLTFGFSFD